MPSGAKKRKAAKKKQEQASSTLKSTNHGSPEEEAVRIVKETGLDSDERIEITDSSHDHDKSSTSSGSGSSSSSSDEESHEVKRKDGDKEETEVITVPSQPVPVAGDAPFIGSTANVIVENTGLMDSTTPSDPNTENIIEISSVDAVLSNEPAAEASLASDEIKLASSSTTGSVKNENEGKTSTLPESKCVPEGSKESEVVISHGEEAPTHGVAQRTSWLSCCGLFDAMTGSSR
ncbi:hypothetical protein N665_0030s0181 [Sinapis alba]|nr:hypothetical protein N665_0030s0181 [Sinapis alba]